VAVGVAVATPAATPAAVALEVEGAPTVVRGSAVPPDATGSVIVQGQPIGPGAVNLVQTIRRRNEEQKTSSKLVTELMLGLLPGVLIYIIYVRNEWALKYCAEDLSQWVLVLALCTILNALLNYLGGYYMLSKLEQCTTPAERQAMAVEVKKAMKPFFLLQHGAGIFFMAWWIIGQQRLWGTYECSDAEAMLALQRNNASAPAGLVLPHCCESSIYDGVKVYIIFTYSILGICVLATCCICCTSVMQGRQGSRE